MMLIIFEMISQKLFLEIIFVLLNILAHILLITFTY